MGSVTQGTYISKKGPAVHQNVFVRLRRLESFPIEQTWLVYLDVKSDVIGSRNENTLNASLMPFMPGGSTIHAQTGDLVVRLQSSVFQAHGVLSQRVITQLSPVHILFTEMEAMVPHIAFNKVWTLTSKFFNEDMDRAKAMICDGSIVERSKTHEQLCKRHDEEVNRLSKSAEWVDEAIDLFELPRSDAKGAIYSVRRALLYIASFYCPQMFGVKAKAA